MTLAGAPSPGFVYRNNITVRDSKGYGVKGDASGEGVVALTQFAPASVFRNNVIVGAKASQYPPNNFYPSSVSDVGFTDPENGDFRLSARSRYKRGGEEGWSLGCDFDRLPKLSR